jgi:DNA modification methylase
METGQRPARRSHRSRAAADVPENGTPETGPDKTGPVKTGPDKTGPVLTGPPELDATDDAGLAPSLEVDQIHLGDAAELLRRIEPASIALSIWSPPYFVGKNYEQDLGYEDWRQLLRRVIAEHQRVLRPAGFLAVNIADILCFADPAIPRWQAEKRGGRRLAVTREDIERVYHENPGFTRYDVARVLGVSEQTVDRRVNHNNIRGGKQAVQTRVRLSGGLLEEAAYEAGLYLYDRRVWVKDPAWENSRWHTNSYRAVDEFEYVYIFWRPGITKVDRQRLSRDEWVEWGSRAVWRIPSVRRNDDHEAKFPLELPRRLIRLLSEPGDTILDPFVGSGTTALAAIGEDRRFLGIDRHAPYVALAQQACRAALEERCRSERRRRNDRS